MEDIVRILNTILRLLQIIVTLGSIAIFIYLGILFYFKKFDEVKKNLPYVLLGLVLLISVYSLPVIILSFLEKNIPRVTITTNRNNSIDCQIIYPDNIFILNDLNIRPNNNICQLYFEFETESNKAYVMCRYGNDNQERINCWGIYGDEYNAASGRTEVRGSSIDFSALRMNLNNLEATQRLFRFPSSANTVYCSSRRISQTLNIDPSDKHYAFIIFSATPNITPCNSSSSNEVNASSSVWNRADVDIFGVIATTTR